MFKKQAMGLGNGVQVGAAFEAQGRRQFPFLIPLSEMIVVQPGLICVMQWTYMMACDEQCERRVGGWKNPWQRP